MRHGTFCMTALLLVAGLSGGCERNDMHNQPRYEPMEPSTFFDDGQSSRPIVVGTVARDQLMPNDMRYAGLAQGPTPDTFPFEITRADLKRGKQRYEIYCGVCHGATGDGNGMIVQRGFVKPPSFHEQRLRDVPVGHYFNVITNGFGAMYSYNDRIYPDDRWRIAAYVRVLQLSQQQALASAGAQPAAATENGSADPVQGAVNNLTGEGRVPQAPTQLQQPQQPPQAQPQPPAPQQPGAPQ